MLSSAKDINVKNNEQLEDNVTDKHMN